jgi:hypothetical protein
MSSLSGFVKQLSEERDHVQRKLSALNAALVAFAGAYRNGTRDDAEEIVSQRPGANCGGAKGSLEKTGVQTPHR